MLETKDLTKKYEDGLLALDHLNLKVEPGEIFCMFGANGAGKTTAINLILGFIPPSEGTAFVEGVDVVREPLKSKDHISYVSENVMLYGNFTAYQNLDYFSKLAGRRNLKRTDYAEVMGRVGLQKNAFDMRVKNFSKGMRQKLGIAVAILKDAPNLILDEPTSGLDPKSGQEFLDLLLELKGKEKSIADRVGFMLQGKMVMLKTSEELQGEDLNRLYVEYMHEHSGSE
jgi:ABC-2 type transport system ATP-binding protein